MRSMSYVNRLPTEIFKCVICTKEFTYDEVKDTWKCPECGDPIYIYAEDLETATRIVLIRKNADELVKGDLVHLSGRLTESPYSVIGINSNSPEKKLSVGLKGYGSYNFSKEESINCRVGKW